MVVGRLRPRRGGEVGRRARNALRRTEVARRAAEQAVDLAAVLICMLDARGRIMRINPAGCAILGRPAGELLGADWFEVTIPPRARAEVRAVFDALMAGEVEPVEYYQNPVVRADGEERLVAFHNTVVRDGAGRIAGVLFAAEDVTDRERAAREIRRAKDEWERTFDAIGDPVMILDTEHRVVRANRATAELLGDGWVCAAGATCYGAIHGRCAPPEGCPHSQLLADGRPRVALVHEPRFDADFLVSVHPLHDPDGRLAGSVHVAHDIAALRRTEAEVVRSERRLREIAGALGEGLIVTDVARVATFLNPAAERLLGYTLAEVAGRDLHDLVHPSRADGSHLPGEECPIAAVARHGGRFTSRDEVFTSKDGRVFPVSVTSTALVDGDRIVGAVTAFQDIGEEKRVEQEREALVVELRRALAEIRTLRGILPVCSYCNKIRDERGEWLRPDAYLAVHTDALPSHGMCDQCAAEQFPEYFDASGKERPGG